MFNLTTTSRQLLQKPSRLGAGLSAVLAPLSAACYSHWSSKTWMCWPSSQDKNIYKKNKNLLSMSLQWGQEEALLGSSEFHIWYHCPTSFFNTPVNFLSFITAFRFSFLTRLSWITARITAELNILNYFCHLASKFKMLPNSFPFSEIWCYLITWASIYIMKLMIFSAMWLSFVNKTLWGLCMHEL